MSGVFLHSRSEGSQLIIFALIYRREVLLELLTSILLPQRPLSSHHLIGCDCVVYAKALCPNSFVLHENGGVMCGVNGGGPQSLSAAKS